MLRYIIIFLAGALGALLANRGISVFNDANEGDQRAGKILKIERKKAG